MFDKVFPRNHRYRARELQPPDCLGNEPTRITGRRASSTDPATWSSYEEALEVWSRSRQRWAGIGFVFHESDPFVGLDLDDSLHNNGNPKPWAREIVERFADTYCEISPSRLGLKIWCRAKLPANVGKVPVGDGGIELYSRARFFTVPLIIDGSE